MKRHIMLVSMIVALPIAAFSQIQEQAEKELLAIAAAGPSSGQVHYQSDEEGFFSPNGPLVSETGILYFIPTYSKGTVISWEKGKWDTIPRPSAWPSFLSTGYVFASQNGRTLLPDTTRYLDWEGGVPVQKEWAEDVQKARKVYATPFGALLEEPSANRVIALEQLPNGQIVQHKDEGARIWLLSQPGGFTIGEHKLLYRNGVLWSAQGPKGGNYANRYIGRLMSGHQVWVGGGMPGWERYLTISNAIGAIELVVELPWAPKLEPREYGFNPFNYSLGPWGELYALIAPYWDEKTSWMPKDGDTAELVVVRNYLRYFGRLNDSNVRLRKDPNTSGDILGTYPAKTGFRILEKGTKEETIGGQKNVWCKVRLLDGKEGWFFGSFVQNLYDGPNGKPPPWPNVPDW